MQLLFDVQLVFVKHVQISLLGEFVMVSKRFIPRRQRFFPSRYFVVCVYVFVYICVFVFRPICVFMFGHICVFVFLFVDVG